MRELEAEQRQLLTDQDALARKAKILRHEISTTRAEIESFDTQQGQQLNFMKKHFPEAAAGWEWVQENQSEFEKEVFGPAMINCSVKDEKYSDQVQALLQQDDFLCFTAQTKTDHKKLTEQLYRVMSLSVVVRTCTHSRDSYKAPIDRAEAAALGLDGFAVDYIDGPAPVLAMLCSQKQIHQSGVALRDHSDAQYERLASNGKVNQWAAGKHSYTVRRRREYGPQAMSTTSKTIQPGRFWTSQPVDSQEKAELGRRFVEKEGEFKILKGENQELRERISAIEDQKAEIGKKIVSTLSPSVWAGRIC